MTLPFNPGFAIRAQHSPLGFQYGPDVFGPVPEQRTLEAIRGSLRNPACDGPEIVYAIVMDVGKVGHRAQLEERMLLYGAVTYASGRLGDEPVRSQGHVHRISQHSGWSPPEVYEIWSGRAFVYMQERAADQPGRCYAVIAEPGDVVIVPPAWAHATISADPMQPLTFGAWCDREYGFEYGEVRRHRGLAWYPLVRPDGTLEWRRNESYAPAELTIKEPNSYAELGLESGTPIYTQFERDPDRFRFISQPETRQDVWAHFVP